MRIFLLLQFTGKAVLAQPESGCDRYLNQDQVKGNIAVVWRGTCFFSSKALFAQMAGAKAVIIIGMIDNV